RARVAAPAVPCMVAREVGAGVVETGGETSGPGERTDEVLDHGRRYATAQHRPQSPMVLLREHALRFALEEEELDVARPRPLVLLLHRVGHGRGMPDGQDGERPRHLR